MMYEPYRDSLVFGRRADRLGMRSLSNESRRHHAGSIERENDGKQEDFT